MNLQVEVQKPSETSFRGIMAGTPRLLSDSCASGRLCMIVLVD